jgi:hypothetical protein
MLVLALPAGCKRTTVAIKTLLDDPAGFDKQTVWVAGTVGNSVGVLGYGVYQINDGTGSLIVVSQEGGAPREGAQVAVEGEFRSAYTVGPHSGAVLIEKQRNVQ